MGFVSVRQSVNYYDNIILPTKFLNLINRFKLRQNLRLMFDN